MFVYENGLNYAYFSEPSAAMIYYVQVPYIDNQMQPTYFYDQNSIAYQSMTPNFFGYSYVPGYTPLDKDEANCQGQTTSGSESSEIEEESEEEILNIEQKRQVRENESKGTKLKLDQKFGRNIESNIFHNILKKASGEGQFENKINAIITCNKMSITRPQFQDKLTEKTKDLKGYVNSKTIKSLLSGKRIGATRGDLEFSKILRILSKLYIDKYHIPHIYYSNKIKDKSRPLHLKRMRKILKVIL